MAVENDICGADLLAAGPESAAHSVRHSMTAGDHLPILFGNLDLHPSSRSQVVATWPTTSARSPMATGRSLSEGTA